MPCLLQPSYHSHHSHHSLIIHGIARTENATLKAKVTELTEQVKVLTFENAALLAEVEMYRKEAALPTFSKLALGQATYGDHDTMDVSNGTTITGDDFVRAGNGVSTPHLESLLSIWYFILTTCLYYMHRCTLRKPS